MFEFQTAANSKEKCPKLKNKSRKTINLHLCWHLSDWKRNEARISLLELGYPPTPRFDGTNPRRGFGQLDKVHASPSASSLALDHHPGGTQPSRFDPIRLVCNDGFSSICCSFHRYISINCIDLYSQSLHRKTIAIYGNLVPGRNIWQLESPYLLVYNQPNLEILGSILENYPFQNKIRGNWNHFLVQIQSTRVSIGGVWYSGAKNEIVWGVDSNQQSWKW